VILTKRSWPGRIFDAVVARLILAPLILGLFPDGHCVLPIRIPQRTMASTTPQFAGGFISKTR